MIELSIEEIQQKFENLPEDLKWAIMAAKVDEKIIEIGNTYRLNVEQMGQLSLETHMVMFGVIHPDKFEESITASLALPSNITKEIVNAINEKILKDIREKLMSLNQAESTNSEKEKDTEILNSAGIQIMSEEKVILKDVVNTNRDDIMKKVENPNLLNKELENKKVDLISAQKLSGSFTIPTVKTEYSLNNISKTNQPTNVLETKPEEISAAPKAPITYPPKADPYRMSPDE